MGKIKQVKTKVDFEQESVVDKDRSNAILSLTSAYLVLELTTLSDFDAFYRAGKLTDDGISNAIAELRSSFYRYVPSSIDPLLEKLHDATYALLETIEAAGDDDCTLTEASFKCMNFLLPNIKQSITENGHTPTQTETVLLSGLANTFAVAMCETGKCVPLCFDVNKLYFLINLVYTDNYMDFVFGVALTASLISFEQNALEMFDYAEVKAVVEKAKQDAIPLFTDKKLYELSMLHAKKCIKEVKDTPKSIKTKIDKLVETGDISIITGDTENIHGDC